MFLVVRSCGPLRHTGRRAASFAPVCGRYCSSSSSSYQGAGDPKRKPLARRPVSEYHEYVPPPPPTPPKPKDFYHEKPQFWKMHGTKLGRKRDLVLVLSTLAFTVVSFAFYSVGPDVHSRLQRRFSIFDSDSPDERELFREEAINFFFKKVPNNPGEEFTAADARELMHKQRFTVRHHSRLREPEETLHWND